MKCAASDLKAYAGASWYAIDCETTGLDPAAPDAHLRTIQFAAPGRPTLFFDLYHTEMHEYQALQLVLSSLHMPWVAHNASFDYSWLRHAKLLPAGQPVCSMLIAQLLTLGLTQKYSLEAVVHRYLKRTIDKTLQSSNWSQRILTPEQRAYAIADVETLRDLMATLVPIVEAAELWPAVTLEIECIPIVAAMKRNGFPFDAAALTELRLELLDEMHWAHEYFLIALDEALPEGEKLPRQLNGDFNTNAKGGFNVGSPKQLREKLTLVLGSEPVDESGKPSVSREALREYAADSKAIQHYLDWKKADKAAQITATLRDSINVMSGRIHADYIQLGAHTGRFSCRSPNLQQVPRRKAFRAAAQAPEGWRLIAADYSQLELRLVAWHTGDPAMIAAFCAGEDLHTVTARRLYKTDKPTSNNRQVAKSANFGLVYGAGAGGLRSYAGACGILMDLEEATQIREDWMGLYAGVAAWHKRCGADARSQAVNTIKIPHTNLTRHLTPTSDRMTVHANTVIQGTGAAILKRALSLLWDEIGTSTDILPCACIHDEIVLLARTPHAEYAASLLQSVMVAAEKEWIGDVLPSVVDVGIGESWATAK